jgi:hypothetical protein
MRRPPFPVSTKSDGGGTGVSPVPDDAALMFDFPSCTLVFFVVKGSKSNDRKGTNVHQIRIFYFIPSKIEPTIPPTTPPSTVRLDS